MNKGNTSTKKVITPHKKASGNKRLAEPVKRGRVVPSRPKK